MKSLSILLLLTLSLLGEDFQPSRLVHANELICIAGYVTTAEDTDTLDLSKDTTGVSFKLNMPVSDTGKTIGGFKYTKTTQSILVYKQTLSEGSEALFLLQPKYSDLDAYEIYTFTIETGVRKDIIEGSCSPILKIP